MMRHPIFRSGASVDRLLLFRLRNCSGRTNGRADGQYNSKFHSDFSRAGERNGQLADDTDVPVGRRD